MLVYLLDNVVSHDLLLILVVISLIIISIVMVYLVYFQNKQLTKELIKKLLKKDDPDNDNLDLKELAKKLESIPKSTTTNLTQYEQSQEEEAIISYDELLKNKNSNNTKFNNNQEIKEYIDNPEDIYLARKEFSSKNYEHEEEFLESLKQLLYSLNK